MCSLCVPVVSKPVKWIFAQWVFPKHACKADDVANCLFYGQPFFCPQNMLGTLSTNVISKVYSGSHVLGFIVGVNAMMSKHMFCQH